MIYYTCTKAVSKENEEKYDEHFKSIYEPLFSVSNPDELVWYFGIVWSANETGPSIQIN